MEDLSHRVEIIERELKELRARVDEALQPHKLRGNALGVGSLMIWIAIIACTLGGLQANRRWEAFRQEAAWHGRLEREWLQMTTEQETRLKTLSRVSKTQADPVFALGTRRLQEYQKKAAAEAALRRSYENRW